MDTFTRQELTFRLDDHAPDGQARGTVVLLHGFPQDRTAYDAVVPLLTAGGLRVLVPDQRGYSPGARPRGRRAYAMDHLVADVVALLDAAGVEQAHVVGHDWGGAVAWALTGNHPERVASLTALSTPHTAATSEGMRHLDQARRSSYMLFFQLPWLPERLLTARRGARTRRALLDSGLERERAERYTARMLEPGATRGALAWYRALPWTARMPVHRTRVPTTYLYGSADPFFAERSVLSTRKYVVGPYEQVALDAGHWLPEHRPDDVARAVLAHVRAGENDRA